MREKHNSGAREMTPGLTARDFHGRKMVFSGDPGGAPASAEQVYSAVERGARAQTPRNGGPGHTGFSWSPWPMRRMVEHGSGHVGNGLYVPEAFFWPRWANRTRNLATMAMGKRFVLRVGNDVISADVDNGVGRQTPQFFWFSSTHRAQLRSWSPSLVVAG